MELSQERKTEIDAMSQEQLARRWRFCPPGDEFWSGKSGEYAFHRFSELGGMTPEISKKIGWREEDYGEE